MSDDHSISRYFDGLRDGDPVSAQKIWERYIDRLIRLAHRKLRGAPRRVLNEEDVVQNAFENFFRQVQQNRFSQLDDRRDLWQILAMLVDRKAKDQLKRLKAKKAGDYYVHGDSINQNGDQATFLEQVPDFFPTGEAGVDLVMSFQEKLDQLPDDRYRRIALLKLEGYSNQEIADKMDISLRTVERRLGETKEIWGNNAS